MRLLQQIASALFPPVSPAEMDGCAPARVWPVAALVAAAAFLICMAFADRRGLWLDEFITLNTNHLSLAEMTTNRFDAGHSPVYFAYARLGAKFGESNYALRSTSALMAAINILMLTGLALALRLRRILPALWLVALMLPYWISIGTEYRYMMFLTAAVSGMLWVAVRYADNFDWRRGMALALAVAAVAWIHASVHLIIFLTGIFIFIRARDGGEKPRPIAGSIASIWPVFIGWSASIPFLIRIAGHQSIAKSAEPSATKLLSNLFQSVLGVDAGYDRISTLRVMIYFLAAAFLVLSIAATGRILLRCGRKSAWQLLAVMLAGMPLIFFVFCMAVKNHQGPVRYLAAYAVPCTFCLAIYIHALWRRAVSRPLALAGLCVFFAQGLIVGLSHGELLREGIDWILKQRGPKDPIVFSMASLPRRFFNERGFHNDECLLGFKLEGIDRKRLEEQVKAALPASTRGYGLLYHTTLPLQQVLGDFKRQRLIADFRIKKVSGSVTILVWSRSAADYKWLKRLRWPKDRIFD